MDTNKGEGGMNVGHMSYAATSIKFAEGIKTMKLGYKL